LVGPGRREKQGALSPRNGNQGGKKKKRKKPPRALIWFFRGLGGGPPLGGQTFPGGQKQDPSGPNAEIFFFFSCPKKGGGGLAGFFYRGGVAKPNVIEAIWLKGGASGAGPPGGTVIDERGRGRRQFSTFSPEGGGLARGANAGGRPGPQKQGIGRGAARNHAGDTFDHIFTGGGGGPIFPWGLHGTNQKNKKWGDPPPAGSETQSRGRAGHWGGGGGNGGGPKGREGGEGRGGGGGRQRAGALYGWKWVGGGGGEPKTGGAAVSRQALSRCGGAISLFSRAAIRDIGAGWGEKKKGRPGGRGHQQNILGPGGGGDGRVIPAELHPGRDGSWGGGKGGKKKNPGIFGRDWGEVFSGRGAGGGRHRGGGVVQGRGVTRMRGVIRGGGICGGTQFRPWGEKRGFLWGAAGGGPFVWGQLSGGGAEGGGRRRDREPFGPRKGGGPAGATFIRIISGQGAPQRAWKFWPETGGSEPTKKQ